MAGGQELLQSEEPIAVTGPRITTPALVIMLGSTSALAGLELMRQMLSLKANDLRRVALVYIDTDDAPATLIEFRRQHNSVFQEFPLRIAVPTGINEIDRIPQTQTEWQIVNLLYRVARQEITQEEAEKEALRAGLTPLPLYLKQRVARQEITQQDAAEEAIKAGFIPPLDIKDLEQHTFIQKKIPQYFANGAGGIRNNGHVAACFHYQHIYDTLDRALINITQLGGQEGESRITEVQIDIVSFLGGGTGSGILADIAVIVRELLTRRMLKQRINIFCMLPEAIRGANLTDINWRKSNATACLLELLAFSTAAATTGSYVKLMRDKVHGLTNDPIANEVYLIGQAGMGDAGDTARIVGLDLFQRITDASGVGTLEHSKWVDRRTLGDVDERGLPTVFGTSCPLEVRFPAEEVATAFAQISAAKLLPLLASYQPLPISVSEGDRREWGKKWRQVARFDAGAGDPMAIKLPEFRRGEFEDASQGQLDMLWTKLERHERALETQIKHVIALKSKEEIRRIDEMPQQDSNGISLLHQRIQHLKRLQQEYRLALEELRDKPTPRVERRPTELEAKLVRRLPVPGIVKPLTRDMASAVCDAYNDRLLTQAKAIRYRLLEQLLKDLSRLVQEALKLSMSWFENAEAEERAQELEAIGRASRAWQGQLEYPHPHQRHIFDLTTLRTRNGRSIATEQLYRWATGVEKPTDENAEIDYGSFVSRCVEYLFRNRPAASSDTNAQDNAALLEEQVAGRLADRVVDFFRDYYHEKFQDTNLFQLLDKAAPPSAKGQSRADQISGYLLQHLQDMQKRLSSLIAFEALLTPQGLAKLDTSIYLGMNWHNGNEKTLLERTVQTLGPVTERSQLPTIELSIDPHRLDLVYGLHAISLSTVREFYLTQNSAMEAYLNHQREWEKTNGTGLMPVHSSGEAQRLVTQPGALGNPSPLVYRIIRQSVLHNTPNPPAGSSPYMNNPAYMGNIPGVNIPYANNQPFVGNIAGMPPGNNPPYQQPDAPLGNQPFANNAQGSPAANQFYPHPNVGQNPPFHMGDAASNPPPANNAGAAAWNPSNIAANPGYQNPVPNKSAVQSGQRGTPSSQNQNPNIVSGVALPASGLPATWQPYGPVPPQANRPLNDNAASRPSDQDQLQKDASAATPILQPPLDPQLVKDFKRWEKHLVYYWTSDKNDANNIGDPDLELPIPYRLAQIQNNKNALEQFVNNNLAAFQKHAARLQAEPTVSKHAYFVAQFGYAVRSGQRALGIPPDQILPWPPLIQQLLARVSHPDLQRVVKEDMALTSAPAKGQQGTPVQPLPASEAQRPGQGLPAAPQRPRNDGFAPQEPDQTALPEWLLNDDLPPPGWKGL